MWTAEEYINHKGVRCPYCKSDNISPDHIKVDDISAWRQVECHNCEMIWVEFFRLDDIEIQEWPLGCEDEIAFLERYPPPHPGEERKVDSEKPNSIECPEIPC